MSVSNACVARLGGAVRRYGATTAVDGVDLQVRAGSMLALLGPNGAGKTTTISLLLGLETPDEGSVELFGEPPQRLAARRRVGVMLQEAALPPVLRVGELIELTSSYYPAPLPLPEAARLAGVSELLNRPYGKLSGGQQRRVQFATAICGDPELLFLDEPTVGLDIQARTRMWETLRALVGDGRAIVLTTHYLEEAEALADQVTVIAGGKVIADGSVEALRARVATRRIACRSRLGAEAVARWAGVERAFEHDGRLTLETASAEALVRRLLAEDPELSELEVRRAGLTEAFLELTKEDAA